MNFIVQSLMNQLKQRNPNGFQFLDQAMKNGGNPQALVQQIMGSATPEQRQNIITQAKNYGVPDNYLAQIQNIKQNNNK